MSPDENSFLIDMTVVAVFHTDCYKEDVLDIRHASLHTVSPEPYEDEE